MMTAKKTTLGRSSGGLPRYYLDVGWWRHRRFSGLDSTTLFVAQAAISYGNEHGSDGHMPADLEDLSIALGVRLSDLKKAAPKLVQREIWSKKGTEFVVRDWSQHNPTRGEIEDLSEERSTLGKRGNHAKWHVAKGVSNPECEFCTPRGDPVGDRPGDPDSDEKGIANASHGMGWDGMGLGSEVSPSLTLVGEGPSRDPRAVVAAEIIANRAIDAYIARGGKVGDRAKYFATTISNVWRDIGAQLDALAANWQDETPEELADSFDPTSELGFCA